MAEKKKMNPIVFMLIATLVNLATIIGILLVLLLVCTWIASTLGAPDSVYSILFLASFVVSFIASFFLYKKFVSWATIKWNVAQDFGKKRR